MTAPIRASAPPSRSPEESQKTQFEELSGLKKRVEFDFYWRQRLLPIDPLYEKEVNFLTDLSLKTWDSYIGHSFGWDKPSSYSLQFNAVFGMRDFQNSSGFDYSGFGGRVAGGLRFNFGEIREHASYLRAFYEIQHLGRDSSNHALAQAGGIEWPTLFHVYPEWLYLGPSLGLGITHYGSDGPIDLNQKFQDTNRVALDSHGVRLELGAQACTWGMKICLAGKGILDSGMKAEAQGLVAPGMSFSAGVDMMRFWDPPSVPALYLQNREEVESIFRRQKEYILEILPTRSDARVLDYTRKYPEVGMDYYELPSRFRTSQFADHGSAAQAIVKSNPQILMFGETHPPFHYPGITCHDIFLERILPTLKDDYRHLVTEFLPHDIPQEELDRVLETGEVRADGAPNLHRLFSYREFGRKREVLKLLQTCKRLGIKLYGGGPPLKNFLEPVENEEELEYAVGEITRHSEAKTRELARRGHRVISYNGAFHNNIHPEFLEYPDMNWLAFGDDLTKDFRVAEIDLIVPQIMTNAFRRSKSSFILVMLRQYTPHLPPKGKVNLVERAPNSYALVSPFEPLNP